jgi:hypothetical protein
MKSRTGRGDVVCAFSGFALLEDRSRSWLVKIGFETMSLRAILHLCTKSRDLKRSSSFPFWGSFLKRSRCTNILVYSPSLDLRSNQGLFDHMVWVLKCTMTGLSTALESEKLWGRGDCKPSFSKALTAVLTGDLLPRTYQCTIQWMPVSLRCGWTSTELIFGFTLVSNSVGNRSLI